MISYSLYLWHFPVLVFSKYLALDAQSVGLRAALLPGSIALATLTWRYVETPFRKRWILQKRPQIFGFAGVSMATLLVLGFFVYHRHGVSSRLSGKALSHLNSKNQWAFGNNMNLEQALAGKFVEFGPQGTNQPISVLIWGDSHAMAVTPVLDDLCRRFSRRGKLVSTVRAIMDSGARVYVLKQVPCQDPDLRRLTAVAIMHSRQPRFCGSEANIARPGPCLQLAKGCQMRRSAAAAGWPTRTASANVQATLAARRLTGLSAGWLLHCEGLDCPQAAKEIAGAGALASSRLRSPACPEGQGSSTDWNPPRRPAS